MRSRREILLVAGLMTCLYATGCGSTVPGGSWPDPVEVTGKVTYNGKPFANGTVIFIPDEKTAGQGGSAQTDETGEYTMQTRWSDQKMKDGLIPGRYKVAFSRYTKPDGTVWVATADSTEGPASSGAREELPLHLSSPGESKYVVEVNKGKGAYDFDVL